MWLRRGGTPLFALLGILSLMGFAAMLTRVDAPFAGRAYAAYGGVYIAASLAWLWMVEGQRPTASDVLGAGLAVAGAIVIETRRGAAATALRYVVSGFSRTVRPIA